MVRLIMLLAIIIAVALGASLVWRSNRTQQNLDHVEDDVLKQRSALLAETAAALAPPSSTTKAASAKPPIPVVEAEPSPAEPRSVPEPDAQVPVVELPADAPTPADEPTLVEAAPDDLAPESPPLVAETPASEVPAVVAIVTPIPNPSEAEAEAMRIRTRERAEAEASRLAEEERVQALAAKAALPEQQKIEPAAEVPLATPGPIVAKPKPAPAPVTSTIGVPEDVPPDPKHVRDVGIVNPETLAGWSAHRSGAKCPSIGWTPPAPGPVWNPAPHSGKPPSHRSR